MANQFAKMTTTGTTVRRWEKELNKVCRERPSPVIELSSTKSLNSSYRSEGVITNERIIIKRQWGMLDDGTIVFQRFDPFPASSLSFRCTYPGCRQCLPSYKLTNRITNHRYLCRGHCKRMEAYVAKKCRENRVDFNKYNSPRNLQGYTALIGLMESGVRQSRLVCQNASIETRRLTQDMFLNVRNFLIITSTAIKPSEEMLNPILTPIMEATLELLKTMGQNDISKPVEFIRHAIDDTLFFFGLMYPWETLSPGSNSYSSLGAGLGGMAGVFCTLATGPAVGLGIMLVGGLTGILTGTGLYLTKRREELMAESIIRYQCFRHIHEHLEEITIVDEEYEAGNNLNYLSGSAYIDGLLVVMLVVQALLLLG